VSPICLDTASAGALRPAASHTDTDEPDVDVIHHALARNIRFLDVRSDDQTGGGLEPTAQALARHLRPEDVVIATTITTGRDASGREIRAAVRDTARRLGIQRLPLVYLADPVNGPFDAVTGPGGAVDVLVALRSAGEIGAVGVTGADLPRLSRYLDLGVLDVVRLHQGWTLADRRAAPLIDQAVAAGVAVVNAPADRTCGSSRDQPAAAAAVRSMELVCRWWGTDLATAALLFSVRDPRIASTVARFTAPAGVTPALEAVEVDLVEPFWDELATLLPGPAHGHHHSQSHPVSQTGTHHHRRTQR
jgi:D-threo-aldose 1-dehydrogenase